MEKKNVSNHQPAIEIPIKSIKFPEIPRKRTSARSSLLRRSTFRYAASACAGVAETGTELRFVGW